MANNIFIFTGEVRSGKTTALVAFAKRNNASGFLTPDAGAKRMFYTIEEDQLYEMETDRNYEGETISVGKFIFRKDTFDRAKQLMNNAGNTDWFIIDEAGPLEIRQDKGFEPELSQLIEKYKSNTVTGKLLIVIRETLIPEALRKYQLSDNSVIHSLDHL